ncbi:MAG: N-acetylmuramoyl-L-alanine amidase [Porticoccaceae bacterium]
MKNNNTQQQSALIAVCLILLTTFASSKLFSAEVNSVRLWRAPDHTRLVFDISEPADYKLFSLQNPQRLVIDIAQGSLSTDFTQLKLTSTPIAKMRSAVRNNGDLRVVLDLSAAIEPRHFTLDSNEQYSDRLVIDLFDKQTAISRSVQQVVEHSDRKIIIAVDAGHGGEDPGALGPKGIMEKNVVLQIAQRIERLLDRDPHFEGLLVRSSDYYLAHRKRTQLAREQRADFFISIHADAFTDSRANGASVYALSNSGATSEAARFLARRENRADLIGGTSALKLGDRDDMLAGVLVDLSMTATMSSSLNAGAYVLKNMGTVARLHKKKVEQAGFLVLKSPDIPSLLIETGFISNPKEARQLSSGSYQQKMATAIYNGLVQYYTENPPLGTLLATAVSGKPLAYLVASGDTLSEIAARYNTSVNRILNYNKLSSSTIRVGQELLIPTR